MHTVLLFFCLVAGVCYPCEKDSHDQSRSTTITTLTESCKPLLAQVCKLTSEHAIWSCSDLRTLIFDYAGDTIILKTPQAEKGCAYFPAKKIEFSDSSTIKVTLFYLSVRKRFDPARPFQILKQDDPYITFDCVSSSCTVSEKAQGDEGTTRSWPEVKEHLEAVSNDGLFQATLDQTSWSSNNMVQCHTVTVRDKKIELIKQAMNSIQQ